MDTVTVKMDFPKDILLAACAGLAMLLRYMETYFLVNLERMAKIEKYENR